MFTFAISCFRHSQFALIHGHNIPGSYAILLFTASDLASIISHIHNWVLFFLWLHLFILSGVVSPLISSSILGSYQPGEFIFQCHVFFFFSYCSWGSQGKSSEVVCHSLLLWNTFCQNSPPWLVCLGWPSTAWLQFHWVRRCCGPEFYVLCLTWLGNFQRFFLVLMFCGPVLLRILLAYCQVFRTHSCNTLTHYHTPWII